MEMNASWEDQRSGGGVRKQNKGGSRERDGVENFRFLILLFFSLFL